MPADTNTEPVNEYERQPVPDSALLGLGRNSLHELSVEDLLSPSSFSRSLGV